MEFRHNDLLPVMKELSKTTLNTGEAATACLAMFVILWHDFHPEQSLEEVAEAARCMILTFEQGRESERQ